MSESAQPKYDPWQKYQIDVDLYKFYLDLTIKVAALFLTLAGAILAYVLARHQDDGVVLAALILPIILSVPLCVLHCNGVKRAGIFVQDHEHLARNLSIENPYDFSFLRDLQCLLTWLYGVLGVGLSFCLYWLFCQ